MEVICFPLILLSAVQIVVFDITVINIENKDQDQLVQVLVSSVPVWRGTISSCRHPLTTFEQRVGWVRLHSTYHQMSLSSQAEKQRSRSEISLPVFVLLPLMVGGQQGNVSIILTSLKIPIFGQNQLQQQIFYSKYQFLLTCKNLI